MKILHITAGPLSPNSGIPVVLKHLSDAQNRLKGIVSRVLSLNDDVKHIKSDCFFSLNSEESFSSFLFNFNPDLAILHSFFHIEYVKVTKQLIRSRIPFFIEPHGSFGKNAMKKSHLKKIIANNTIFRAQIKRCKGYIFTNNSEFKDSIYRTAYDLIIPNGIDPDIVNSARVKHPKSIKNPVLYFLGRFDIHHKGLDYLFDALDILDGQKYKLNIRLYGTGNDEQILYVKDRLERYTTLKVENCGTIYGQEKKDALEICNILILTSRYEGSPMTVLDGLSYGNPCIATPGTNIADEIVENSIGWKAELSANSIAQTIIKAIDAYKEDGENYFDRCRRYVLRNYSWERIGEYSIEQYKKVLH